MLKSFPSSFCNFLNKCDLPSPRNFMSKGWKQQPRRNATTQPIAPAQAAPSSSASPNPSASSSAPFPRGETVMNVFDRNAKRLQRERSAASSEGNLFDYLKKEIGYRVADRIKDVSRKFETAVEVGCGKGFLAPHIYSDMVGKLHILDASKVILDSSEPSSEVETIPVHHDDEINLPFENNSVDLVISSLHLHWINNLPGLFRNIYQILKPDGCLIASMFGGETLYQLRCSLQLAESEREGGFAAHISPFTSIRDLGNLLNRAGFNLLTMDVDEITVKYPSMFELMADLKGMGENNAAWSRKLHLGRDSMLAAASIYRETYGDEKGNVPATFQILYMIGWKPHASQAKPAERGSGEVSFKDIAALTEPKGKKPKI